MCTADTALESSGACDGIWAPRRVLRIVREKYHNIIVVSDVMCAYRVFRQKKFYFTNKTKAQ